MFSLCLCNPNPLGIPASSHSPKRVRIGQIGSSPCKPLQKTRQYLTASDKGHEEVKVGEGVLKKSDAIVNVRWIDG